MIAPRIKRRIYLQSFMDALITFSSFWAFLFILILLDQTNSSRYSDSFDRYLIYSFIAFAAILWQGLRSFYSHPRWWTPNFEESHHLSLNQVLSVAVVLALFLLATNDKSISRLFLIPWLSLLYFCLLVANRFLPAKIAETVFPGWRERTVFLGTLESTWALARWRKHQEAMGTEFLDYKPDFSISDLANLERILRERNVTQLILTEIPEVKYNLHYIIDICDRVGVQMMVFNNLEHLFRHKVALTEVAGLQFIGLGDEPLEQPQHRFIKRALDLAIAVPMVLVVLPAASLVVWLMQRFQSPGPLFFKEVRAGLNERRFSMLKFRTMHPAPNLDATNFRFGQWLRRTGLDELPQFLNVLRGEMSVVGPRPHRHESELFARALQKYHVRSNVKPGITGLAQVRGLRGEFKSEHEVIRRVELDIAYVDAWSLNLDLAILAQTVWRIFRPRKSAMEAPERGRQEP